MPRSNVDVVGTEESGVSVCVVFPSSLSGNDCPDFFAGVDGLTLWGWSGTGNPNSVSLLEGRDYTVGGGFMLAPEDVTRWGSHTKQFVRYDAIHVLDIDTSGTARFQLINKTKSPSYDVDKGWQPGAQATYPIYALPASQLSANLRPDSEPVAAVIEGLALAKPFEYALRNGEVKIDVSAQKQFKDNSPIVRHIKIGRYHLLATYDPAWQRPGYAPGSVTLTNFDGVPGLNLTIGLGHYGNCGTATAGHTAKFTCNRGGA